jgi:signal recognition particle receptor subunit beta
MVSLATPVDRTLYFDFLPIRVPNVRGLEVRLQLFTVPGQVYYNSTRKLVLTGADGAVFVADSQQGRADANLESLENLRDNLREHGRTLAELPHVLQFNKRDLEGIVPIDELERRLNRHAAPSFATVAIEGDGVYESLESITRAVLEDFERRAPDIRSLPEQRLELPEGGLADALRDHERSGRVEPAAIVGFDPSELPSEPRLSTAPEADLGEAAARAVVDSSRRSSRAGALAEADGSEDGGPRTPRSDASGSSAAPRPTEAPPAGAESGASFGPLWPPSERGVVRELESALAREDFTRAVNFCEQILSRTLASAASVLGSTSDAPRDPTVIALLLGLDGRRYLEFRALLKDSRAGRPMTQNEALSAFALAIDARLARTKVGA